MNGDFFVLMMLYIECCLPSLQMTSVSLDKQIGFFQSTVENDLPNVLNEEAKLESHLSESLFVVSTALNDHFHNKTFRGSSDFALYLQNEFSKRLQVHVT